MTPAELKIMRKSLGLSQAEFARAVGVASDRTVRKWEDGEREIPGPVLTILGMIDGNNAARAWLIDGAKSQTSAGKIPMRRRA